MKLRICFLKDQKNWYTVRLKQWEVFLNQIIKIRNEREGVTTDTVGKKDGKRILWIIVHQKLTNLKGINKFLKTHKLLRIAHEKMENLNRHN